MRELSLNILDIAQNSLSAGAGLVTLTVDEDSGADSLTLRVEDDGRGMDADTLQRVRDPFYTTRTTRKVGMGIPLFRMAAEMTGGSLDIVSEPGKGTAVTASFSLSHIDRMPLGDMAGTLSALIRLNPQVDFVYRHRRDGREAALDTRELRQVQGSIDVDHVSFSYDGDLAVLHNVDLHVQPGETVAIVGPSGGGKSTLCQLIPRFYDVSSGSIRIDGVDVRQVKQRSIHQNIGIVQQDVFLFADTIFENIRYGKPDATEEEVYEAARKAEIYDDILAMPDGFDTYVGERGALLSGGQKQRVSIARIFLKNPPILILDEATSALDSVTEAKIQRAFDNLSKGRTTLIIAHRLSTIRSASRIVSIADGVIQEEGTHAELLKQGGLYADLYKTQSNLAC